MRAGPGSRTFRRGARRGNGDSRHENQDEPNTLVSRVKGYERKNHGGGRQRDPGEPAETR